MLFSIPLESLRLALKRLHKLCPYKVVPNRAVRAKTESSSSAAPAAAPSTPNMQNRVYVHVDPQQAQLTLTMHPVELYADFTAGHVCVTADIVMRALSTSDQATAQEFLFSAVPPACSKKERMRTPPVEAIVRADDLEAVVEQLTLSDHEQHPYVVCVQASTMGSRMHFLLVSGGDAWLPVAQEDTLGSLGGFLGETPKALETAVDKVALWPMRRADVKQSLSYVRKFAAKPRRNARAAVVVLSGHEDRSLEGLWVRPGMSVATASDGFIQGQAGLRWTAEAPEAWRQTFGHAFARPMCISTLGARIIETFARGSRVFPDAVRIGFMEASLSPQAESPPVSKVQALSGAKWRCVLRHRDDHAGLLTYAFISVHESSLPLICVNQTFAPYLQTSRRQLLRRLVESHPAAVSGVTGACETYGTYEEVQLSAPSTLGLVTKDGTYGEETAEELRSCRVVNRADMYAQQDHTNRQLKWRADLKRTALAVRRLPTEQAALSIAVAKVDPAGPPAALLCVHNPVRTHAAYISVKPYDK